MIRLQFTEDQAPSLTTLHFQNIRIKNICPAQKDKPHNEIEMLLGGQNVLDILEKELIALSG